jgi:methylmalonyl-CoA/ethylmalonyl-CoA epimerase
MRLGFAHVSIVVPDIEAAARLLQEKYGLATGERKLNEQQGVRLAYVDVGAAKIELMEPARPDSPVSKFLERNPRGGIHHFCLSVDDVATASQDLAAKGVRTLGDGKAQFNVAGDRIAFIHPHDFLGALVELEEHQPNEAPHEARSA